MWITCGGQVSDCYYRIWLWTGCTTWVLGCLINQQLSWSRTYLAHHRAERWSRFSRWAWLQLRNSLGGLFDGFVRVCCRQRHLLFPGPWLRSCLGLGRGRRTSETTRLFSFRRCAFRSPQRLCHSKLLDLMAYKNAVLGSRRQIVNKYSGVKRVLSLLFCDSSLALLWIGWQFQAELVFNVVSD